jgi:hypothetical protein
MIFFDVVCDFEGCNHIQPVYIEAMDETWRDAIILLREHGWTVEMDGVKARKCYCPDHITIYNGAYCGDKP